MDMLRDAHKSVARAQVKATAKTWAKRTALWGLGIVVAVLALGQSLIMYDNYRSPEVVERIHARTVTMDMVEGKNLPPMPPETERDATVAGVDSNNNGVRDDVEIAIHERHPDSPKIRAAQLQYAMVLQSQLTEVFSKTTLVAVLEEDGRAYICMNSVYPVRRDGLPEDRPIYEWTEAEMDLGNKYSKEHSNLIDPLIKEVDSLVVNTSDRVKSRERSYQFMTSYGESDKAKDCDVFTEDEL